MNTLEFILWVLGSFFLAIILPIILTIGLGMNGFVAFILLVSIVIASIILYNKIGHERFESYSKILRLPIKTNPRSLPYGVVLTIIGSILFMSAESNLVRSYYSNGSISFDAITGFLVVISIITLFAGVGMLISREKKLGLLIALLGFGLMFSGSIDLALLGFTLMIITIMIMLYVAEREGIMTWGEPTG